MPKVIGVNEGSFNSDENLERKQMLWVRNQQHSITYIVLAETVNVTEEDVKAATGIPPLFYPLNGCFCVKRIAKQVQTIRHPSTGGIGALWEVQCDFDSAVDPQQNEEPENKRPVCEWKSEFEDEVLEKDPITQAPIETKCKEPIFLEHPKCIPVLEITRYERYPFDPDIILDYADHVNSKKFYGAPEGCAYMADINTTEEFIDTRLYVKATYRIKFKIKKDAQGNMLQDSWKFKVPHIGYQYFKKDENGDPIGDPVTYIDQDSGNPEKVRLKNSNGTRLEFGEDTEYLEFNKGPKVNFNNLSLGPF